MSSDPSASLGDSYPPSLTGSTLDLPERDFPQIDLVTKIKELGARLATTVSFVLIEDNFQPPPEAWHLWLDLQVLNWYFGERNPHAATLEDEIRRLLRVEECGPLVNRACADCAGVLARILSIIDGLEQPNRKRQKIIWVQEVVTELGQLARVLEAHVSIWIVVTQLTDLPFLHFDNPWKGRLMPFRLSALTRQLELLKSYIHGTHMPAIPELDDSERIPSENWSISSKADDQQSTYWSIKSPTRQDNDGSSIYWSLRQSSALSLLTWSTGQRSHRNSRWRHDLIMDMNSGFASGAPFGEKYKGVIEGREKGFGLPKERGPGRTGKAPAQIPEAMIKAARNSFSTRGARKKALIAKIVALTQEMELKLRVVSFRVLLVNSDLDCPMGYSWWPQELSLGMLKALQLQLDAYWWRPFLQLSPTELNAELKAFSETWREDDDLMIPYDNLYFNSLRNATFRKLEKISWDYERVQKMIFQMEAVQRTRLPMGLHYALEDEALGQEFYELLASRKQPYVVRERGSVQTLFQGEGVEELLDRLEDIIVSCRQLRDGTAERRDAEAEDVNGVLAEFPEMGIFTRAGVKFEQRRDAEAEDVTGVFAEFPEMDIFTRAGVKSEQIRFKCRE